MHRGRQRHAGLYKYIWQTVCDLRQLGGKPPCAEISWVLVSFPVQKPRGQEEEYDSAASTEYNWNLAIIPGLISGCGISLFPTVFFQKSFLNIPQQPRAGSCSKGSSSQLLGCLCWVPKEECCKRWLDASTSPKWTSWFPWSLGL